jgi:PAS domain S-box-containing protein
MADEATTGLAETKDLNASMQAAVVAHVLDELPDVILLLDANWRIVYANQTARRVSRIKPENLNRETLWELYPEIAGTNLEKAYRESAATGIERVVDAFYYEPFQTWFDIRIMPTQHGVVAHYRDVTAQRVHEDALRASEERYRVLTELNPQALWTADEQGRVLYANQRFLEYIGKDFIPKDGTEYLQCFYEGDRDRVLQVWSHSVATGEDYVIDARLVRASDGAVRWWHLRALPIRDETGAIQQWLGVATDVHETRVAGDLLREQYAEMERQRRELEAIYRGSPIGLALYEPKELRLIRLNDRQSHILGLRPEDALGKPIEELTPGLTDSHQMIRRAARGEPVLNGEVEGVLPSRPGEHRYWSVNYSPIFAEDGSVHAIAGATIEITQQKRAELALLQGEKLAVVGRLASSIAHEINNPLESVINLIYLARRYAVLPEVQRLLDAADEELRRVSIIATQTLRFHRQATRPQAVSCSDLFSTVLSIYEGRFKNSNIRVEKRKRADKPVVCFEGDIRQVLSNVVGNAIDAMPGGGRLLVRSREAIDWRNGRPGIVLTVADTGSGIDAQTQSRIFEAFFTTKGFGGTGLGLWISAEIMERHQGRIRMRSSQREGHRGTVVALFLPTQM